jgi:hypothetical protein
MPRQLLKFFCHLLRNTNRPQQSSHDNTRYPRLIGTVTKHLKNDLRTKALQEGLSALFIMCIVDRLRSLSLNTSTINFSQKWQNLKVLIFKLMYCANTVHLSFTPSSLYAVTCNTLVHISFIFNFNVPYGVNNKYKLWRSKLWGLWDLTQVRTSEDQSPALLCAHIFLFVGRHIFCISNAM